jgi:hypothetical protein
MMNPGWEAALEAAAGDLAPGGRMAVVDFHQTPLGWFRRWMGQHQVRLDGHLLPALCKRFRPRLASREPAYHGAWEYFLFLGTNRAAMDAQGGPANGQFSRARRLPLTPVPQPESSAPAAARGRFFAVPPRAGNAAFRRQRPGRVGDIGVLGSAARCGTTAA